MFWRWLNRATWFWTLCAGLMLGIVELTKMTWVVLFGLWPVLWGLWWWHNRGVRGRTFAAAQGESGGAAKGEGAEAAPGAGQLAVILVLAVYVINAGYGFEGSFRRLGDYTFVSRTLAGEDSLLEAGQGGNRFAGTWLGRIPVPLPENYLGGIDLQKLDFEQGKESYLCGHWKQGGWWYYYLYAALLKVPLGTWVLASLALGLTVGDLGSSHGARTLASPAGGGYSAGWRNELVLLLPAVVVFLLVSSQTGFSRYFRYVLPCFPFAFIWISKVARSIRLGHRTVMALGGAAMVWSMGSSLWHYPHSMSYFNELAGGPTGGHYHLVDANIDWGQDMWYLKRWLDEHPEARPLRMAYLGFVHPRHFGIEYTRPPEGPDPGVQYTEADANVEQLGPQPGWYAMSVHRIHSNTENYLYFLRFRPVAMAGYSIYIYHITVEQANRVRKELGLPELKTG